MSDFIVTESGEVYDENGEVNYWLGNSGKRGQEYVLCSYGPVHRLVASHYIPNPDNKPEVHHRDENVKNNHISNLMWVTKKENNSLHNCNTVFYITNGKNSYVTHNLSEFCEFFNLDKSALRKTSIETKAKDKRYQHKGYSIIKKEPLPLVERLLENIMIPYIEKTE